MIVVDSTVWIDFFNGRSTKKSIILEKVMQYDRIVLLDLIKIELLQGTKTDTDFDKINQALSLLQLENSLDSSTISLSIEIYRTLRKKGITIRKTIDTIIAAYCINNGYTLLHNDRDFTNIGKCFFLKVL